MFREIPGTLSSKPLIRFNVAYQRYSPVVTAVPRHGWLIPKVFTPPADETS